MNRRLCWWDRCICRPPDTSTFPDVSVLCAECWVRVRVSAPSFALQDPTAHLLISLACTQLPTQLSYIPFSGASSFYPHCYYDP